VYVLPLFALSLAHTDTYTYQRYIVGKVHCGENPCVLVGLCGERTHIRTYVQVIHCGKTALWGKYVRPSWSLWGKYTHTHPHTHTDTHRDWQLIIVVLHVNATWSHMCVLCV